MMLYPDDGDVSVQASDEYVSHTQHMYIQLCKDSVFDYFQEYKNEEQTSVAVVGCLLFWGERLSSQHAGERYESASREFRRLI